MSETKLFDVVLTNLNNVCSLEEERMMHLSSIFVNMRNKPLLGNYGVDHAAVHEKATSLYTVSGWFHLFISIFEHFCVKYECVRACVRKRIIRFPRRPISLLRT